MRERYHSSQPVTLRDALRMLRYYRGRELAAGLLRDLRPGFAVCMNERLLLQNDAHTFRLFYLD